MSNARPRAHSTCFYGRLERSSPPEILPPYPPPTPPKPALRYNVPLQRLPPKPWHRYDHHRVTHMEHLSSNPYLSSPSLNTAPPRSSQSLSTKVASPRKLAMKRIPWPGCKGWGCEENLRGCAGMGNRQETTLKVASNAYVLGISILCKTMRGGARRLMKRLRQTTTYSCMRDHGK